MAANLTPQYQKAEREYRQALTTADQSECLTRMLQLIPRHKGTEKLQADLRSRLREVRLQIQQEATTSRVGSPYRFARQGAGRVVLVGGPNCGKSRILKELTRADPVVSPWPFSTREPLPGMLVWRDVPIQVIDTPPVVAGQFEPWLLNLIRSADAILLVLNGASDDGPDEAVQVMRELRQRRTSLSTFAGFDETDFTVQKIPALVVVTHAADADCQLRLDMLTDQQLSELPMLKTELSNPESVESLRDAVFRSLNVIRVYTRRPGATTVDPDPVTLPRNGTVEQLALELHQDLFDRLSHARVWGQHVHDGQVVGRQFELTDGDVVELH